MSDMYYGSPNPRRLMRSATNRVVAGVCAGIGESINVDPTFVRIAGVLGLIFLFPLTVAAYVLLWIVVPRRAFAMTAPTPDEQRFWQSVSQGPDITFSNLKYKFRELEQRLAQLEKAATAEETKLRRAFKAIEGEQP